MTREEAINKVREMNLPKETKEILEALAPELAESEDERIRKEIIDFIQWAEDRGMTRHDYHQAKRPAVWIAYLEKQKECVVDNNKTSAEEDERIRARLIEYFQGFLEGYEDCYKDGGCIKWEGLDVKSILAWLEKQKDHFRDATKKVEQKPAQTVEEKEYVRTLKGLVSDFIRDSGGGITDIEYYQNICDWLDGRHIEQKPAEWDDYTKTNLGRAIQIIKDARGTLHGYQTDDGIYECDKAIEALEHFLYRGLEIEKSAEWSEEDEENFKWFDKFFRAESVVSGGKDIPQDKYLWFKSRRPQPKQEWSEEDEEMLNSCISSIEEAKENRYAYKENDGDTSYDREIAWLKSLPERFNLQSKQEQNDYITPHKEFFKFIYDRLINVHKENPNVDYMRSFKERLNNLSFGEKQEWSEEDKRKLQHCIDIVGVWEGNYDIAYAPYSNFLKSLRPSWKPSEEQMKALEECGECKRCIKELYEQLKKL